MLESGEFVKCSRCKSTGLIKKVVRGIVQIEWKRPGAEMAMMHWPNVEKAPVLCSYCIH